MRTLAMFALSLLLVSPVATAQVRPNPFEAYEGSRQAAAEEDEVEGDEDERDEDESDVGEEEEGEGEESDEDGPTGAFSAGQWNAGADLSFARTSSRNELLDGPDVSETTLFSRFDLSGGYFLMDSLEFGANLGLVARRVHRGESDAATVASVAIQPMARYHLSVTHRFSAYAQVSAGGFFGRSGRDLTVNTDDGPQEIETRTTTRGVIASGGAGVGYRISEEFHVRFGFDGTWLWGREQVPSSEDSLDTSTNHIGATAGVRYFF